MSSPEPVDRRPSKVLQLLVEALEGRRLPSGMGGPPGGPGGWPGTFVYRTDGPGGPSGSAFPTPGAHPPAPPPGQWSARGFGPMDGFAGHAEPYHDFGPQDRVMFSKGVMA